ncbi:MAG: 30S ribosomal protein S20 [Candidatus Marinimicrobia bacterium]|nr:30S ribosomal protein S20 [Candidatus Neomarinimicrobiota bacterium]|tara:strand:+ start:3114 stop:3368 length:255 start_codon:yes stop_codon:yes gene_type:complete
MDRHPQQIKRERQDKKRREINVSKKSTLNTHIKNVLHSSKKEEAEPLYKAAVSAIDKAIKTNLIHKNTGSRRKSRITKHLNSLS